MVKDGIIIDLITIIVTIITKISLPLVLIVSTGIRTRTTGGAASMHPVLHVAVLAMMQIRTAVI